MSHNFKVGDRVRCLRDLGSFNLLKVGKEYTIASLSGMRDVTLEGIDPSFYQKRFELVRSATKANTEDMLTISYMGTTIHLNASNPKSRMFAEAVLNLAYGGVE